MKITKIENEDDELRHDILDNVILMAASKCHDGHKECYQTAVKLMSIEIEEEASCIIPFTRAYYQRYGKGSQGVTLLRKIMAQMKKICPRKEKPRKLTKREWKEREKKLKGKEEKAKAKTMKDDKPATGQTHGLTPVVRVREY